MGIRLDDNGITTPDFWDCECEHDYIHPKSIIACGKCETTQENQPDSHYTEVMAAINSGYIKG
jgi:hypothetical protein